MGITSVGHGIIDEGGEAKSNQVWNHAIQNGLHGMIFTLLEDVVLSTEDSDAGRWSFSLVFIYIYTNNKRPKGGRLTKFRP